MAGVIERGVKKELECGICYERFRNPKLLPCDHSFCEECLTNHIVSKVPRGGRSFDCPMCRSEIEKPFHGIESRRDWAKYFPTDRFLVSLLEAVNNFEELHSHAVCYRHSRDNAVSFCMGCMILMCQGCGKRHHANENCRIFPIKLAFRRLKPELKDLKKTFEHQIESIASLMNREIYAESLERSKQNALKDLQKIEEKALAFCNDIKENIKELRRSIKHDGGFRSEDQYQKQCKIVLNHLEATKKAFESQYTQRHADEILNDLAKFRAQANEYQKAMDLIALDGDIREIRFIPNQGLKKVLLTKGNVGSIHIYYDDNPDDDVSEFDQDSVANERLPGINIRPRTVRRRPPFQPHARFVLPDIREEFKQARVERTSHRMFTAWHPRSGGPP
ncbi:hypothetical protein FSP39_009030 [Pinctada imbricata]|uniref:Uncharacterized protein n=1 Tax=Pinctada imbricata TaxID=66713 RepID=A0AA89C2Y7_PINIB|nr:hypothetical protein FSP39_009030 [Pinctada imbricata]